MTTTTSNQSRNLSLSFVNDYDQCTFTNRILLRYVGTLIFFVGIVSTLLSIGVFTRRALRKSTCRTDAR